MQKETGLNPACTHYITKNDVITEFRRDSNPSELHTLVFMYSLFKLNTSTLLK